jgi:hypothetical protein
MGSRGKKMVEISLEGLNYGEAAADIATIEPDSDFYVLEPEKELLDCINTLGEWSLEKFELALWRRR